MSGLEEMMKAREAKKRRKPVFVRQDAHKKAKLGWKWRKPKGMHSKMRLHKRGKRRCVQIGWGSPKKVINFDKSGLRIKMVSSIKDMDAVIKNEEGIIISKRVGMRKKIGLLKKAQEKELAVLNVRDIPNYLKEAEDSIKKKKELKEKTKKEGERKKKESKTKKEGGIEKVMNEEEKKKEEKKEKDELLTKKI